MNLKSLLPWLCVVALLIGLGWTYAITQKQQVELAALRQDSEQLQKLRADLEASKASHSEADAAELARLRRDNEELLRLRNEVRQLRGEKQQLAGQVQAAQTQAQGAEARMEALNAKAAQPNPGVPPGPGTRATLSPAALEQANTAACINNLRMIDAAKQQWALEHQKPGNALLTAADITPYLRSNTLPVCPAGGVYTLNPVAVPPICNIPGHTLK